MDANLNPSGWSTVQLLKTTYNIQIWIIPNTLSYSFQQNCHIRMFFTFIKNESSFMYIWLCHWCWCMAGMQIFSDFATGVAVHKWKIAFPRFGLQFVWHSVSLLLNFFNFMLYLTPVFMEECFQFLTFDLFLLAWMCRVFMTKSPLLTHAF